MDALRPDRSTPWPPSKGAVTPPPVSEPLDEVSMLQQVQDSGVRLLQRNRFTLGGWRREFKPLSAEAFVLQAHKNPASLAVQAPGCEPVALQSADDLAALGAL